MRYLNDKSEAGVERWMVASAAFQRYDPTRRFADLHVMLQEDWLAKTEAILKVIYDAAGAVNEKPLQQTHRRKKAG